jgi:hypothetical protein
MSTARAGEFERSQPPWRHNSFDAPRPRLGTAVRMQRPSLLKRLPASSGLTDSPG